MRWIVVFFLLLWLTGCNLFEPVGEYRVEPQPEWKQMWVEAQECTGRHGRWADLRFWVVPVEGMDPKIAGHTEGHDIYLRQDYAGTDPYSLFVVRHEMIHALGVHGHPRVPFVDPCHATWDSRQ
jgi:hypothetical protein